MDCLDVICGVLVCFTSSINHFPLFLPSDRSVNPRVHDPRRRVPHRRAPLPQAVRSAAEAHLGGAQQAAGRVPAKTTEGVGHGTAG
jgi:hypothetical protein